LTIIKENIMKNGEYSYLFRKPACSHLVKPMTRIRSAIECLKNSRFRAQPKSSVALLLSPPAKKQPSSLVLAVTSEQLARWSHFTLHTAAKVASEAP
jgi:hypothetical protein